MNLNPENPEVSVVIPTYNYAHFLKKCLESLVSQEFTNWEALVINNFSTDDTVEVVGGFSDKRIRLVNFRNNGVIAASRNKGIGLAASDLIAFLDSDDIWYPGKLRASLEGLNAGADLTCHGMRYMVNGRHWKDAAYKARTKSDFFRLLYKAPHIFTSSVVVRKQHLLETGGFDENPADLQHCFFITYNLSQTIQSKKMAFLRSLFGYTSIKKKKKYVIKGLLEKIQGKRVGVQAILLPKQVLPEIRKLLKEYNISYVIKEVWMK